MYYPANGDEPEAMISGLACELVVPYSWSPKKRPKTGIPVSGSSGAIPSAR